MGPSQVVQAVIQSTPDAAGEVYVTVPSFDANQRLGPVPVHPAGATVAVDAECWLVFDQRSDPALALVVAPTAGVDPQAAIDAHAADTTAVHGIADTAALVVTTDPRLSDARTPTAHTHPQSDVTGLVTALGAKIDATVFDAKGDLLGATAADTPARLAVGANGHVLTADSAQPTGWKWAAVAGASTPPVVTALPGSPVDGQEVYYLADATNGILFHLKYRAASGSTHKWECVGGSALSSEVSTSFSASNSASYEAPGTPNAVTVPLAGEYEITFGYVGYIGGAGAFVMSSVKFSASAAVDADNAYHENIVATAYTQTGQRVLGRRTVPAGQSVSQHFRGSGGSYTIVRRWISVMPLRVS